MKTYAAIKAEIAKLEKKAEAARKAEVAGVVARIREAIAAYGLTAQDLGLRAGGAARGAREDGTRAQAARPTVGVPKYRDPETGRTWTGRGKPPAWIAGAKDRDGFLIAEALPSADAPGRRAGKGPRKGRGAAKAAGGGRRASAGRKGAASRKREMPPEKTGAVEIESGVATE